jgi:hypothetical protein
LREVSHGVVPVQSAVNTLTQLLRHIPLHIRETLKQDVLERTDQPNSLYYLTKIQ